MKFARFTLFIFTLIWSASVQASNPWGGDVTPALSTDGSQPVSRGYIVPSVEPAPGGAKLTVDIYHMTQDSAVTLTLQAVVNDGTGKLSVIALRKLSDNLADNPSGYISHRKFDLNYDELNQMFRQQSPGAPKLVIGPSTPLFVYAYFNQSGHQWGGVWRSGIFFLPVPAGAAVTPPAEVEDSSRFPQTRPVALDIAYPIIQSLANVYNIDNGKRGLQVNGQVRSRVEAEGKFQLTDKEFENVRKLLFQLSSDPTLASQVLGAGWSIALESRYLKRDSQNQLVLGPEGFPVPDPMVDTYYDNARWDAARNDMAIRYRWTQGNQTGAWNFKPGMGVDAGNGIVYRVEYGLDTTDDKPESLKKFADSNHPLNPFQWIGSVVPGATASSFLEPAVKLTDYRYKFIFKHQNGLAIEVSADDVRAEVIREGVSASGPGRYYQLELDIEHLAVASQNVSSSNGNFAFSSWGGMEGAPLTQYLAGLQSAAFFDGRPVLHNLEDLKPTSPVRTARQADFALASQVIDRLRGHVLGNQWTPGSQKYAYSVFALGLLKKSESSRSVQRLDEGPQTAPSPAASCAEQLAANP